MEGLRLAPMAISCVTLIFGVIVAQASTAHAGSTYLRAHGPIQVKHVAFQPSCGLGFDFGTSGVRVCVLGHDKARVFEAAETWPSPAAVEDAEEWKNLLFGILGKVPGDVRARIGSVAVSGTSASCLVVDRATGTVRRKARLYNWDAMRKSPEAGEQALELLRKRAPPLHTTLSGTSSLMKTVTWHLESPFTSDEIMLHQADYLAGQLMHESSGEEFPRTSDLNNVLKLGYDVAALRYPQWFDGLESDLGVRWADILPTKVVQPGTSMGRVSSGLCRDIGLPSGCKVVGGTTDSIAAFIAAGASEPGQTVTSLGSTMAIKMLSVNPVEDASRGVYSHRLGDTWLVGGASNVGCAVLREQGFSNEELEELSEAIDPNVDVNLDYYPLAGPGGERFPVCDPNKKAVLDPRPDSRQDFLHGILQGIARVEKECYTLLADLGATPVTEVLTAGGGSKNPTWTRMRRRILGVPTSRAAEADAAYGAALLALKGLQTDRPKAA